ncbi:unnamed protein product [Choristocarpus tenellus]
MDISVKSVNGNGKSNDDCAMNEIDGAGSSHSFTPKNILVTGGAGFIASHVVILLVKKYPQYNIVNFDRLDYCSCLENLSEMKDYPNYKVSSLTYHRFLA